MTRSSAASTVALLVGAFAISFFGTVLIRKSAPSAAVATSTWAGDAEAAGRIRDREEALARSVGALRLESRKLRDQISRKSQELSARVGKLRSEGAAGADPKGALDLDNMTGLLTKMLVREKIRIAKEELGLDPSQMQTYEARLNDAVEKNPLQLVENNAAPFDEETLVPLLDRGQLEKYRKRARSQAESEAQTETTRIAGELEISKELAGKVYAIFREEGVEDKNAFLKLLGKPEEAQELVPKFAAATDRARARLRPILSPEAFEKLERTFADGTEALKILVEEMRKQEKKD